MRIGLLFLVCFISLANISFAQDVIVTKDSSAINTKVTEENVVSVKTPVPRSREILADMKIYNPEMYSQYRSGKKMQRTGIILTAIGGGFVLMGGIFALIPDTSDGEITIWPYVIETGGDHSGLRTAGAVLMIGGAACLAVGLPVMIVGGKKKKQTFRDFKNQHYLSQQPSSHFQFNLYSNRVGLAYVF